jgi:hypothetical protein
MYVCIYIKAYIYIYIYIHTYVYLIRRASLVVHSIRKRIHTDADVYACSIRSGCIRIPDTACVPRCSRHSCPRPPAYVSIRQHPSAYVSIRQHMLFATLLSAPACIRQHPSAYVSIRRHPSAYVSIRQHTSAYVK